MMDSQSLIVMDTLKWMIRDWTVQRVYQRFNISLTFTALLKLNKWK